MRERPPPARPNARFPTTSDGRYTLDLIVDPDFGLNALYINELRALSFRYYAVGKADLALSSDRGSQSISGSVKVRAKARCGGCRERTGGLTEPRPKREGELDLAICEAED
jgi:hypothetical protein